MIDYDELYEYLRKEKYGDQLQTLPRGFVSQISDYFMEKKKELTSEDNLFSEEMISEKRQFENAISIFKELVLRRKRKILNLVFIASETGIMKRDFGNMLKFEQELFEKLIHSVEEADKDLKEVLAGKEEKSEKVLNKMVIVDKNITAFVDMEGKVIGPFESGSLANLDAQVADILVSEGKARLVDE